MVYHVDEQAMLAIKVMHDRVPNCSMVAEYFGIPARTAWKYATQENHDRRTPVYYIRERKDKRRIKLKILSDFIRASIGNEKGSQSRLARQAGLERQEISHTLKEKHFFRKKKLARVLEVLNAPYTLRRDLGLNQ